MNRFAWTDTETRPGYLTKCVVLRNRSYGTSYHELIMETAFDASVTFAGRKILELAELLDEAEDVIRQAALGETELLGRIKRALRGDD